ncbi:MAG: thiamine-phosphate synthase family protein [Sulfolobales archaeon]
MSTPFDIVNNVLPYIKALIAWNLSNRGLSQRQIAKSLYVSQALISKYLSKPPQYYISKLKWLGLNEDEVNNVVEVVTNYIVGRRPHDATSYLTIFLLTKLKDGRLCKAHKLLIQGLANCNICYYLTPGVSDEIIQRVKYVLENLEAIRNVGALVPEVGMNIVEARPNARSTSEVVGIPGRVVKVFNTIKAVSEPTYGSSRFMASVLLEVMKYFPNIKSAANIKYSKEIEDSIRKLKLNTTTIGPYENRSIETVVTLISNELKKMKTPPDAIIDLGPPGFEHLIYILAEDSIKLLEKLRLITSVIQG